MAGIEIVIKIPEKVYKNIQSKSTKIQAEGYTVENAILNGVPLPKGHGRIIDESKINKCEQTGLVMKNGKVNRCLLTDAPTVIEADK